MSYTQAELKALPHAVKAAATAAAIHAQTYPKRRGKDVSPEEAFDAVVAAYLAEQATTAPAEQLEGE